MNEFAKLSSGCLFACWRWGWAWLGRPLGPGARTGAVDAFGIDSAAVLAAGLVRQNSLRDLRSLRSNSCRKSETVACVSFGTHAKPRHCAPRRPGSRPRPQGPAEPRLETLCQFQRYQARPCSCLLASPTSRGNGGNSHDVSWQGPACLRAAAGPLGRRAAQRSRPRLCAEGHTSVRHLACGSCLSGVNEVNAASSAAGPASRAAQGSRRKAPTARVGAPPPAGTQALASHPTPARVARCGAGAHRPLPARHPHKTQEQQKRSPP